MENEGAGYEYGNQFSFSKSVNPSITAQQIERLIKESCVAEFIHGILCILSVGFYNIWKSKTGVVLSILFFIGNLPYIIIQRYNRPHFITLRERLILREESKINANG